MVPSSSVWVLITPTPSYKPPSSGLWLLPAITASMRPQWSTERSAVGRQAPVLETFITVSSECQLTTLLSTLFSSADSSSEVDSLKKRSSELIYIQVKLLISWQTGSKQIDYSEWYRLSDLLLVYNSLHYIHSKNHSCGFCLLMETLTDREIR